MKKPLSSVTFHGLVASLLTTLLMAASLSLGCTTEPESADPLPHELPPPGDEGKYDNYVSTNAREFDLMGTAHVVLPEDFSTREEEDQAAMLDRMVERRLSVVARSLERHVDAIIDESNGDITGEDAQWFVYFKRDNAQAELPRVLEDGRAAFDFQVEFVGSYYLMSKVAPEAGTHRTFDMEVKEWGETEGEKISVEIKGSESRDAFPKYNELFADGVYDIAVHFGGDYNEERFDLDTAKWLVEMLIEDGWSNESVTSFEDLTIDSPPFIQPVVVEGKEVEVQVYIYHSDMVTSDEEYLLSDAMKTSLAERDVVIYSGHAGSNAGFILDYQPRHEIDNDEFAGLELAEKYQIYVFDGCQTYRTYVDDLMENPKKTFDNVDIVTTVNTTPFGAGYQVLFEFVYWFTLTDREGTHFPMSWMTILRAINTEDFRSVHYGVHGVDNDPQLNPHASEGIACQPCETDADCGAGGNFCLGYSGGAACGVACTTDTACPDGYRCARLYDDPDLFYLPKQCVRRDYICQ